MNRGLTPQDASIRAEYLAPRVVFTGEQRTVRVFGPGLGSADGQSVFVDDKRIGTLTAVGPREGRVDLPGLAPGEHFLRVGDAAATNTPTRIFAVARKNYEDADVLIAGRPMRWIYDLERDAFFGVFSDLSGAPWKVERIQFDGSHWRVDAVDLPAAFALSMTADGRELLVTGNACLLIHVDPDSLAIRQTQPLPTCPSDGHAGLIEALADGQILYGAVDQWASLRQYSNGAEVMAPSLDSPTWLVSQYATRLIWASSPNISGPMHPIYHHDVESDAFTEFQTLSGDYYVDGILALSGDGERFMHYSSLYDHDFRFLGRVASGSEQPSAVGLSGDGRVAATVDVTRQSVTTYDVSGSASPFPALLEVPLPMDQFGYLNRLVLDDAGRTVFVFSSRPLDMNNNAYEFHFVVRRLSPAKSP
jgi:hypothetical protein